MPRTIVDIPPEQMRAVDQLCKRFAISRAEAVRRALAEYLTAQTEVRQDGFGLWASAAPTKPRAPR